jgi:nitrate/nitrite transport system substrate-binding protein
MEDFIEKNPKTYRSLIKAMVEACRWCSRIENKEELAELASARAFTGAKAIYTRAALTGDYNYGGFDGQERKKYIPDATLFFDMADYLKDDTNDHSTFLWHSQGLWLMTQSARWKQIRSLPDDPVNVVSKSWRTDLYRDIVSEIGIACPKENLKIEPGSRFIDGIEFNPEDLRGYLDSQNKKY